MDRDRHPGPDEPKRPETPDPVYTDFSTCERRNCRPSHRDSYHEPTPIGRMSVGGSFYTQGDRSILEAASVLRDMHVASADDRPTLPPLQIPPSGRLAQNITTEAHPNAQVSPPQTLEPPLSAGSASQATISPQTPLSNGALYNPPRHLSSNPSSAFSHLPPYSQQQPQLPQITYPSTPVFPDQYFQHMAPHMPPPSRSGYFISPPQSRRYHEPRHSRQHDGHIERSFEYNPNYAPSYHPNYDYSRAPSRYEYSREPSRYDHSRDSNRHDYSRDPSRYVYTDPARYEYPSAAPTIGIKRAAPDDVEDDDDLERKPSKKPKNPEKMKPYTCFFRDCKESKKVPPRKAVSQFFGRNKACTGMIHQDVWLDICRKHYQQRSYRQKSRNSLGEFQAWLVGLHLDNCDMYDGERDWTIGLDKKLEDQRKAHLELEKVVDAEDEKYLEEKKLQEETQRLEEEKLRASKKHPKQGSKQDSEKDPYEDLKKMLLLDAPPLNSIKTEDDKDGPKRKPPPNSAMVKFAIRLRKAGFVGEHKSTNDCRHMLEFMDTWASRHRWPSGLPYIEFLPQGTWPNSPRVGAKLIRTELDLDGANSSPEEYRKAAAARLRFEKQTQQESVQTAVTADEIDEGNDETDEEEGEDTDDAATELDEDEEDEEEDVDADGTEDEEEIVESIVSVKRRTARAPGRR